MSINIENDVNVTTNIKMSASKIIIHKFEAGGFNFKSLKITSEDGDNKNCTTKYTEWIDGDISVKKKYPDKSSRLVVKIVSGNEIDKFNLDSSAKEIDATDTIMTNFTKYILQQKTSEDFNNRNGEEQNMEFIQFDGHKSAICNEQFALQCNKNDHGLIDSEDLSPLECSLEKVKENNAKIMENIHMLNRTLNYTKKKEILDIVYPKSMRSYPCNTCGKCFVYQTGLRRHYAMRHSLLQMQPRWQIVWTCIKCFQVWPRHDQALNHSSDCCKSTSSDCVREIKTSSLLQCEFCEKVFTSIPRLLRHCKIHTTSSNYECNVCQMAFTSYKLAEQHWVSCSWLKTFYSFLLPKLLLCNSCDRKFRNYDQLYNHRYKVDHFMTKTHYSSHNLKSQSMLVYQCESCGVWYPSVGPLKAHKIQYHAKHDITMQCNSNNDFYE